MTQQIQIPGVKAFSKSLTDFARHLKKAERTQLTHARSMAGIPLNTDGFRFSTKHQKDEPKPETPKRKKKLPKNAGMFSNDAYVRYWNLHHQRTIYLREQARIVHIVYGFLRGRSYAEMEQTSYSTPGGMSDSWEEVEATLEEIIKDENLDARVINQKFAEWLSEAREHFKTKGNLNKIKTKNVTEKKRA